MGEVSLCPFRDEVGLGCGVWCMGRGIDFDSLGIHIVFPLSNRTLFRRSSSRVSDL